MISCSKVPITGRSQLNLLPESQMLALSNTQYNEFLSQNQVVSTNNSQTEMVKRVGNNIRVAVERFLKEQGHEELIADYAWEFNLVQDNTVNAWCMPGGKVVVYTGIMPIAQTDDGLATVMGHEIAHAVARHGNERMSQGLVAELGGTALQVAIADKPAQTQQLFNTAYGLGAQYGVLLPFGRTQETEADRLGTIFMALAGYDPAASISFWQRMAQNAGGSAPPEFLSTHPSNETRINNLKNKFVPEAQKYTQKHEEMVVQK